MRLADGVLLQLISTAMRLDGAINEENISTDDHVEDRLKNGAVADRDETKREREKTNSLGRTSG